MNLFFFILLRISLAEKKSVCKEKLGENWLSIKDYRSGVENEKCILIESGLGSFRDVRKILFNKITYIHIRYFYDLKLKS